MLPSSSLFAVKEQTLSRFIAILCIVTLVSHKVLLNVEHNRNHGAAYHEQQLQSSLPQQQRQQQQQQQKQEAVSGTGGQQQTTNEVPPRREQDVLLSRGDHDYKNTPQINTQAMMNNAITVGSSSINGKKKTTTTNQQQMKNSSTTHTPLLDFVIAGFPKCGTSTLLYSLASHSETIMAPRERCDATKNNITDQVAREVLHRALGSTAAMSAAEEAAVTARQRKYQRHNELESEEPSSSGGVAPVTRRGFKCPIIMKNTRSIERILRLSPGTKFIVGVRHPIGMIQSYYNYRVKEIYDHLLAEQQQPQQPGEIRKLAQKEYIPAFDAIVNGTIASWKGVSRNVTQFDKSLRQLGKLTNLIQPPPSSKNNGTAAAPPQEQPGARARSGPRLFLYSLEQMQDGNTARKSIFRRELQQFLGLQKWIPPFGYDNPGNSRVPHDESIDICSERYENLRKELAVEGRRAANWIIHQLLLQQGNGNNNGNIVVPNQDHFVSTLRRWGTDPCVIRNNKKKKTPPSPAKITSTNNSSAPPSGAVVAATKEG